MKTLEIIFLVVISWLIVGYLFALLKVWYWNKNIIKNDYAEKYADSGNAPFGVIISIVLIWPFQALVWILSDYSQNYQKIAMPVTPLGFQDSPAFIGRIRSNINYAIISGESNYWASYDFKKVEINGRDYIKRQFGKSILAGWFHLIFWIFGMFCMVLYLSIYCIASFIFWLIKLLSHTYPKKLSNF